MNTITNDPNITPADVALMQRLFSHLRSTSGTHVAPDPSSAFTPPQPPHSLPPPSVYTPSQPPPSQPSATVFTPFQSQPSPSRPPPSVYTPSQPPPSQSPLSTNHTVQPITDQYLSSAISRVQPASHDVTSTYLGHPTSSTRALSSSQPFLGFNELSIGMTGQANQRRLASAATHLPRQPQLVTRGSRVNRGRRRGPAIHPPSLPRGPTVEDCTYVASSANGNDLQMVRIRAYIYPPKSPSISRGDFILYRNASAELDAFLERFALRRSYEVPLSMLLCDLISTIATDLENSEHNFSFTRPARSRYIPGYEPPVMNLLSIINRGRRRPSTGAIHLRPAHNLTPQTDVDAIIHSRAFMISDLTIQDSRIVLYFAIREHPVTLMTTIDPADDIARLHTCLSRKFYFMFGHDAYNGHPNEPSSDEDDEEEEDLFRDQRYQRPSSSHPLPHSSSTLVHPPSSPIASPPTSPVIHTNPLQRGDSLVVLSILPRTIWTQDFIHTPGCYDGVFAGRQVILDKVYQLACSDPETFGLDIKGTSVDAIAVELRASLELAANKGDFTEVLSPNRSFRVVDTNGYYRSNGIGVEREVILSLYQQFKHQETRWFQPNDDGYSLLATSLPLAASQNVSKTRMRDMAVLGAVVSLCLMRGITAAPLDPLFLYFCVYECNDINIIRPTLLAEWHPGLKQVIADWIATGPTGNVTPFQHYFASYHDLQVGRLRERDQHVHDAIAVQMLFRVVVGPEPPTHPEIQAFRHGFDLPCSNGFRFTEVLKSLPGGCESFFAKCYSSHIASFEALVDHLEIVEPPRNEMEPIRQALGDPSLSLTKVFLDFLRGKEAPCPQHLSAASIYFPNVIDLSRIGEEGFRAKHFCWAATGSYEWELGVSPIKVQFVQDGDPMYSTRHLSSVMASEGKFSYATCFQSVYIPISYVLRLAKATYPDPSGEPKSFVEAVQHWILCETLNAIGAHTIA